MQGTSIYSIVTTKDPIGLDGLLARLKAGAPRGNLSFKETRVGDKVLYQKQWKIELNDRKEVDRVEEECFCIAEKNILITGDFKMVQKILQRKEKPRFSPHFAAALKKDGVPVRAIVDLATMPKELQKVFLEKKEWAAGLQMMSVSFRETGTVQFSLSLAFKDAERAAAVKNMVSAATMAGLVGLDWSFRDEPDAPEKDREVWKAGRTMLENGRVSLNGKEATAVYSIDIDMFPRLQRWVWAPRASSKKAK